jgi:hypothetical protein
MNATDDQKQAKDPVDVLGWEYSALRSEILHRSAARFSMLPVGLAVFALLVALMDTKADISRPIAVGVLAFYVVAVGVPFFYAGRAIGKLSNQVVLLERRINREMGGSDLLTWEAEAQAKRKWLGRLSFGRPLPQRRGTERFLLDSCTLDSGATLRAN